MNKAKEFLDKLTQTRGEGWARMVDRWADLKRELDGIPISDTLARGPKERAVVMEMTKLAIQGGFHGVPKGIYPDAEALILLRQEDADALAAGITIIDEDGEVDDA